MPNLATPDLTLHAPRSPHVGLGGYVHLPRLLDKARAHLAGKAGEYHYNCPLDKNFFAFTGISEVEMLEAIKTAQSDSEVIAFVKSKTKRVPSEIAAWSAWMRTNAPGASSGHEWIGEVIKTAGPDRTDIHGFFDLLDMDDYVSFGGRA